jgi:hypothetical protein
MTSFGIRVKFNDSEMDVLQKALDHHLNLWRREVRKGNGAARYISIKRLRITSKADLKHGRPFSMDDSQIEAVRHALKAYSERSQNPGGLSVTARERRLIKKIDATLERELNRAIKDASLTWAARGML